MQTISFTAEARDLSTKPKAIRKAGRIPAVLYGGKTLEHFTVHQSDVKHLIYTPEFKLASVTLAGNVHNCILKDIQFHPLTDNITHIDFLTLEDGRKVNIEIPVKFKGVSPGVKEGGKLQQSMRRVKVKLDPKYIVNELYIDISELLLGDAVRVRDIEPNEHIEIMVNEATPVAIVEVPRALKSAEAEAAAPVAAAAETTEA